MIEFKNYHEFIELLDSHALTGHRLFEGIVTNRISGFNAGKITVSGDETFFVYYKNENLLAWNATRGCCVVMGPDSISFLARRDAQPLSNSDINSDPEKNPKNIPLGTEIGIIGLRANQKLQNAVLVDLFLSNIQELLTAFPEDQILAPDRYAPLADFKPHYGGRRCNQVS